MNKKETSQNNAGNNLVEIMALFLDGRLDKDSMSQGDQNLLGFYMGVYLEDDKFKATIDKRRKQMINTEGQRTSLFAPEVIDNISKRKRKTKPEARGFQPSLWSENKEESERSNIVGGIDPKDEIVTLGKELNSRFYRNSNSINKEIKNKKETLRNEIGLPIARGKDPHVGDRFYKYLVKRICTRDTLGIFSENDRVWVKRDEKLNMKIGEVKGLVDELLNDKSIGRNEKYRRYNKFLKEFKERWEE